MNSFLTKQLGPEVFKYICSGLASGATMYGAGFVLKMIGFPAILASTLAALLSFVVSYFLQRFWVFSAARVATLLSTLKFILVTTVTWSVGLSWVWLADSELKMPYEWSQLVLVLIVSGMNFSINKLWTFKASIAPD